MSRLKMITFLFVFFCSIFLLSAHEQSLPLKKGDIGLSYIFYPRFSYKAVAVLSVDSNTGEPANLKHSYINEGFSALSGKGDFISFEYGFFDVFSAGLRFTLVGFVANGVSSNFWDFQSSLYARYDMLTTEDFKCHIVSELWCNPLFTNVPVDSFRSRNFILFNTVSANWRTGENTEKEIQLHFFTDLNLISTILHPECKDRNLWLAGWNFSDEQKKNVNLEVSGGNRLALSTGLDFTWKKFTTSIEINIPIFSHSITGIQIELIDPAWDIVDFLLNNIQLKWKYRF